MVSKTATARPAGLPLNVKTLNGDQLHRLNTEPDAEYLVIDLGGISPQASQIVEVAMRAAVTAVLATLPDSTYNKVKERQPAADDLINHAGDEVRHPAITERYLRNLRRQDELNNRIYKESHWFSASELSRMAGFLNTNPSSGPNRWKSAGRIFAIQSNGKDYYPAYAVDEGGRPLPIVKQVMQIFAGRKTSWGLAIWFGSPNSWLGGDKPKDVLLTASEQVLIAAKAEMERGVHG